MSNDIETIKEKIDIVDLISEYLQLKSAGTNHKGLCPFHNEKSPSFMVNREGQFFHCFGCGKSGDIFTFVEEIEGMEFKEALKYLADKSGIQLSNDFKSEVDSSQKNRVKKINADASNFFYNFLLKMDVSRPAFDYLLDRGLDQELIDEWKIGFVPDQWDLLTKYLLKKGHSIDDLVASGLTIKRDNADVSSMRGFYDRFRGRIMFPIWDVHGSVVGFTGRILIEKENSGGKYVNTPQTLVYDKSRVIYGLNKAKQSIKQEDLIVMVEGQMDVIACHGAGMKNVVASSGTALTQEQVKLLSRYSKNMAMAFDADEAGQNAAKRGIEIALDQGLNIKVINIPDGAGKDPDECIKKDKKVWFESVKTAKNIMDFYLQRALSNKDLTDPRQKQKAVNNFLADLVFIPYAVERDHWLGKLSEAVGVDISVLRDDLKNVQYQQKNKKYSNKNTPQSSNEISKIPEKNKTDVLLENIFGIVFLWPSLFATIKDNDSFADSLTGDFSALYEKIKIVYTKDNKIDYGLLKEKMSSEEKKLFELTKMKAEKDFVNISEKDINEELGKHIELYDKELLKNKKEGIRIKIEEAEKAGDKDRVIELLQDLIS